MPKLTACYVKGIEFKMQGSRTIYFRTPQKTRPELPLFVFLPGMDGTGQLLRAQTAGLEKSFDVRCLAIPPDDLTNWDDLVTQVLALIRTELDGEVDRPVYLCGESFGGCLAMKVAAHSPQLFDRVILINPASSFHRRPWIQWGSMVTRYLPEPLYQISCIGLMPFLASLARIEAADRQALLQAMQSVTQSTSIWRISMLGDFRISQAELHRMNQPVLLVASRGDRLLPSVAEAALLLEQLPKAKVHILPDSGHACLLESDVNLHKIMEESGFLLSVEKVAVGSRD